MAVVVPSDDDDDDDEDKDDDDDDDEALHPMTLFSKAREAYVNYSQRH